MPLDNRKKPKKEILKIQILSFIKKFIRIFNEYANWPAFTFLHLIGSYILRCNNSFLLHF